MKLHSFILVQTPSKDGAASLDSGFRRNDAADFRSAARHSGGSRNPGFSKRAACPPLLRSYLKIYLKSNRFAATSGQSVDFRFDS
jgi:hypothetical protein